MTHRTLALVLAAGKGNRIKHLLEDDEPVKAMIKVGDSRVIDLILRSLDSIDCDKAVLTYPSVEYTTLDERVVSHGVRVVKQKVHQFKLPYLLELPVTLLGLYGLLRDYDSVITLQGDKVLEGVNFQEFLGFHYSHLNDSNQRQITLLSRLGEYPACRTELFEMEADRVKHNRKYRGKEVEGYEVSVCGAFIFSKGIMQNPLLSLRGLLFDNFVRGSLENVTVFRYLDKSEWKNYGTPESLEKYLNRKAVPEGMDLRPMEKDPDYHKVGSVREGRLGLTERTTWVHIRDGSLVGVVERAEGLLPWQFGESRIPPDLARVDGSAWQYFTQRGVPEGIYNTLIKPALNLQPESQG